MDIYVLLRGRGPNNIEPTGYRADYTVVKLLQHISELCLLVKIKVQLHRECDEQLAKVMNSKNSCNFAHFGENYMNWFNSFVAGTDVRKNTAFL